MNREIEKSLTDFHFGELSEASRLHLERDLFCDPELLLNYFDLKRRIESAATVPQMPSPHLWDGLKEKAQRKWNKKTLSISIGIAIAAGVALFLFFSAQNEKGHGILFDGRDELSTNSTVL